MDRGIFWGDYSVLIFEPPHNLHPGCRIKDVERLIFELSWVCNIMY